MKTVYWKVHRYENNYWVVSYWTKPDKSNQIFTKLKQANEDILKAEIEQSTGLKKFEMEHVK